MFDYPLKTERVKEFIGRLCVSNFWFFQDAHFFTYYECGVGSIFSHPLKTDRVGYGVDN